MMDEQLQLDRLEDVMAVLRRRDRDRPVLVLGGTGKTGGRVADRLRAKGTPVRIGSRKGTPPFDWDDRSTWPAALAGARAAYICYYPDVAVPGAADVVGSFVEQAVTAGARRLVLLSGRGEEEAQRAESLLRQSQAEWTIVRSSWFDQNFSESFLLDMVLAGEVALPAGDVREPFVDTDDIADVATAALAEQGHEGQLYEVTGPRLLTFAEAVEEIASAAGREVGFVQLSRDAFADALRAESVPDDYVWLLDYLFATVLDGRNQYVTDGVQRALGREPREFGDYARAAAATGVWATGADRVA
jgi:uncharacterized protein YbjT (DUF2867 family)